MPRNLIYGNEPYLIDKMRREIIERVKTPEFNLMDTCEFTEAEKRFLRQHPLLGGKKTLVFRAKSIKECADLAEYTAERGKSTDVYIFCEKVDKRSKVFKRFPKEEIKVCDKLSRDVLERTIMQSIKKSGCKITSDAYQLYLQLVNYDSDDANLYDVHYSLERLCSVKEITRDVVEGMVMDREKEDVYALIQLVVGRRYHDVFRQADLILRNQPNNVIGVLSLLLRSYRLAYKMQVCNCSLDALGIAYRTFVPKLPPETCNQAMDALDEAIRKIKSGFYKQDIALKITLAKLCSLQTEAKEKRT